jgi:hypothetical protein
LRSSSAASTRYRRFRLKPQRLQGGDFLAIVLAQQHRALLDSVAFLHRQLEHLPELRQRQLRREPKAW